MRYLLYKSKYFKNLLNKISGVIVLSIFVTQVINFGVFVIMPKPNIQIYKYDWLISTIPSDILFIFSTPQNKRQAIIEKMDNQEFLDISWQLEDPQKPINIRLLPELVHLQKKIQQELSSDNNLVKSVTIYSKSSKSAEKLDIIPPNWQDKRPILSKGFNENPVDLQGSFRLEIQGSDNSWLIIKSKKDDNIFYQMLPLLIGFIISILTIRILAAFISMQMLIRLDLMAAAAEKMGIEHLPQPINEVGLGEFAIIAHSLNKMHSRLKDFVDERTRMIAAISHDLRTPLTRMKLNAEFIKNKHPKQAIISNINQMQELIEATLIFAQNDYNPAYKQKIDIAALLISITDEFCDEGAHIKYNGPDHLSFLCHTQMIKRALCNLIENSIKFAKEIEVTLVSNQDNMFIQIEDDGPGIPEQDIKKVVEPFFRIDISRNEHKGSFGLGLSISNDIISAHGGIMSLENKIPNGLKVNIFLPNVTN